MSAISVLVQCFSVVCELVKLKFPAELVTLDYITASLTTNTINHDTTCYRANNEKSLAEVS